MAQVTSISLSGYEHDFEGWKIIMLKFSLFLSVFVQGRPTDSWVVVIAPNIFPLAKEFAKGKMFRYNENIVNMREKKTEPIVLGTWIF